MTATKAQAQALAAFITRIREDWDHPGIVAAIQKASTLGSAADIGVALCRLAGNAELRTPATLADPGTHWRDTRVGKLPPPVTCPEHSAEKAGACRVCAAQSVPPPSAIADARKSLLHRARTNIGPNRKPPTPSNLTATRARADQLEAATS